MLKPTAMQMPTKTTINPTNTQQVKKESIETLELNL
jgi:hypothetical protein